MVRVYTSWYPLHSTALPRPFDRADCADVGRVQARKDLDSLEILMRFIQFLIHARHTHTPLCLPPSPLSLCVVALPCGSFCRQSMSPYLSRWGTRIPIQSAICIDIFTGRPESSCLYGGISQQQQPQQHFTLPLCPPSSSMASHCVRYGPLGEASVGANGTGAIDKLTK